MTHEQRHVSVLTQRMMAQALKLDLGDRAAPDSQDRKDEHIARGDQGNSPSVLEGHPQTVRTDSAIDERLG